jgi:hypothetical protein
LLIKDLWPEPLASVVDSRGQEQLEEWQIVPITFADVCAWAYVAKKHQTYDHTRIYHLLYKSPIGEINTVYPVVIRIQGILGRFELAPLGTWNG